MKKLLIIGARGHGKVLADIALKMDKWASIAFLDDDKSLKTSMGIDIIGTSERVINYIDSYEIIVGIGHNATRQKIFEMLEALGARIPVLIHPNAVIGEQVKIDDGTVVMAGAVINCCTQIGKGCIINTGSTIDHDSLVEDYVHISPGAHIAGAVKVGNGAWLGIGSVVSNNVNITKGCIVGAGAVVVKDINEPGTFVGVPARRV